jgi:DNA-3-methyladenine glycosylase II
MANAKTNHHHPAPIHLSSTDPVLARIIAQVGPYGVRRRPGQFRALVASIISQQLAGSAARAIFARFVGLFPGRSFPTPEQVMRVPMARLRKVGLSKAKAIYIREIAAQVAAGKLNFRRFPRMDDEAIIAELTKVRGIGRWTAEMFLMFNLGRPDVLPVGDLGFQNAVMRAYGLAKRPTPKELRELGERWRPHRSAAVWYLWQSLQIVTPEKIAAKRAPSGSRKRA